MNKWIERQRNIVDFTLSSLGRRKGKNILLIVVYTTVVLFLASVIFFTNSLKKEASIVLSDSPEMIVQHMMVGRHDPIPLKYVDTIKNISGITEVRPRLWGYYYDPIVGANYTLIVPTDTPLEKGQIIIGEGVSRVRQASSGDTLEFQTFRGDIVSLTVKKTMAKDSELVSSDLVLISEDDFRIISGFPRGFATDIAVWIKNSRERPMAALKVAGLLPDTRQILKEEILRTYNTVFDWRSGMIIVILSSALLSFVILAWDKASGLGIEEKREIGILKAIGWETSDVLLMKFWEGMAISLTSLLTGVLLAYLHIYFMSAFIFESALKGWSVLYPEFTTIPDVNLFELGILFFLTVVPYTVMTIVPAWRAATIDPDLMMR